MFYQFKIRENIAERRRVYLHLVNATDGITAATTESGGQPQLTKNGGTPVNTENKLVQVDPTNSPGLYYVELTGGELDTYGFVIVRYKSASVAEFQIIGQVLDFDPYDRQGGIPPWQFAGDDISYDKIKKIVREEFDSRSDTDQYDELTSQIQSLVTLVKKIKIPDPEKVNLTPVIQEIRILASKVASIKIPSPEKLDLSPVLSKLQNLQDSQMPDEVAVILKELNNGFQELVERVKGFVASDTSEIKQQVNKLVDKVDSMPYVVIEPKKVEKPARRFG